ncbi:hypothetical protein JW998_06590 [candidate division KSB1 bacterium]|nr:hypothetical protein [candidate division KSB1 bacterium]
MKYLRVMAMAICATLVSYVSLFAQQTAPRSMADGYNDLGDGTTGFTMTEFDAGIQSEIIDLSEVLMLTPHVNTVMLSRTGGWSLSGILWQYDNTGYVAEDAAYITRALDVDDITQYVDDADSTVYLITDFDGNKVIAWEVGKINVPWMPPNGINDSENGPVDADFFVENGSQYVLVTYKSTDKVVKFGYDLQKEVWAYGGFGVLSSPSDAEKIPSTDQIVIADTGNRRAIIVNADSTIDWEYTGPNGNFSPVDVEHVMHPTLGEQILITDQTGHRVLLVNRENRNITWQFGTGAAGNSRRELRLPSDADWVAATGNVLIADKGNNRIIEVNVADSSHFYQWPNAVPDVEDVDVDVNIDGTINDGFLVSLKVNRNGRDFWLPTRLAFTPPADKEGPLKSDISIIRDLDGDQREVDFRSITLHAQDTPYTTIDYQFRSAPIDASINESDPWYGPDGILTRYHYDGADGAGIPLSSRHKPHTSCQFGAYLSTDSSRVTPRIDSVAVVYNYYDVLPSQGDHPSLYIQADTLIGPAADAPVAVAWDTLKLFWKPVEIEERFLRDLQFQLSIYNAADGRLLVAHSWEDVENGAQTILLANEIGLRGAKQITFAVALRTLNSGLAPQLDGWKFSWREIEIGPPTLQFADSSGVPMQFYTATDIIPATDDSIFVDKAYLRLANALQPTDTLYIDITAPQTNDVVSDTLVYESSQMIYKSISGKPIILIDTTAPADPTNDRLELVDRQSLFVEFRSILRPDDILSDSIMVVQGTIGNVIIQNENRNAITQANLDDYLHLQIDNEMDRNLHPSHQDTIYAVLRNNMTDDSENVMLLEQGTAGIYNSGTFTTDDNSRVLLATDPYSPPDDGNLYSRRGDRISAEYKDNFLKTTTYRFIIIPPDTTGPGIESVFSLEIAPNPYREIDGENFQLRAASGTGTLTLTKLEIYNFAGERISLREGSAIMFSNIGSNTIAQRNYARINNWWNLLTDSGHQAASGTYWLKAEAIVNGTTVSAIEKFVVIR